MTSRERNHVAGVSEGVCRREMTHKRCVYQPFKAQKSAVAGFSHKALMRSRCYDKQTKATIHSHEDRHP